MYIKVYVEIQVHKYQIFIS